MLDGRKILTIYIIQPTALANTAVAMSIDEELFHAKFEPDF